MIPRLLALAAAVEHWARSVPRRVAEWWRTRGVETDDQWLTRIRADWGTPTEAERQIALHRARYGYKVPARAYKNERAASMVRHPSGRVS